MDQLINMIVERTGISTEQAREATNTVLGFLKERLPEPIASQVESVLSGQSSGSIAEQAEQKLGNLGNLFG